MAAMKYDDGLPLREEETDKARITWAVHGGQAQSLDHANLHGIGDVAKRFGLTLRALRFYDSKGLLRPLRDGQVRYYGPKDLIRIELILKGKQLGFTLAEIISMLSDPKQGVTPDLMLSREQMLTQIEHLENQQRMNDVALVELRKRYYLMSDVAETA